MTLYVDLLFFLNLYLDFLILMTTSIVLKRHAPLKRIILGSLMGVITLLILIYPLNNISLFIFKIVVGLLMNIITFKYQNLKYTLTNFIYFYMISIILGGFIYYLNLEFSYTTLGLMFIENGFNLNLGFIFLLTPVILILYIKQAKDFKSNYNLYYPVSLTLKDGTKLNLNGYLDTGNKLYDPTTNKPIILIEKNIIDLTKYPVMYVPFNSLNNHNLLPCIKPKEVKINEKKYFNYLVGITDKKFNMNGVECILHSKLLEEIE